MENISLLFDEFAMAYQRSLFAIDRELELLTKAREVLRSKTKKQIEQEKNQSVAKTVNMVSVKMQQLNDIFKSLTETDETIIKAAEFLVFGKVLFRDINKNVFSDYSIPWIIPFLGHGNVLLESNGDDCQFLGLQLVVNALLQTAPGQLSVSVINPELRPEFSLCSSLPDFKMLTRDTEIQDELAFTLREVVQNDKLIQGRYTSLVALRKETQQPVGKLKILVIQDIPKGQKDISISDLRKIAKGAPRTGIAILYLHSIFPGNADTFAAELKQMPIVSTFSKEGDVWRNIDPLFDNLVFSFPPLKKEQLMQSISSVVEMAKNSSAITIPFDQVENIGNCWMESSASNLRFNLGKAGVDTVSVCLGDSVTQLHNILISGAAGKGKSNLLEVMIHSLCSKYSPNELELYLLDFKDGLTFKPYASFEDSSWLPHAKMLGLESDRDVGLAVLNDLEIERRDRAYLFSESEGVVHDFESYRKQNPDKQLPRIVLIIDEFQKLFDINDDISEEAAFLLENLVRQGRACAIHIVLASQSITGAVGLLGKDERIYAQFPVRIALQNTVAESYSIFRLGNDAASKLRVRGEAIINDNYGDVNSNRKFTVAYADPMVMKSIRRSFCEKWDRNKRPVIFAKKDITDYSMFIPQIKEWRKNTIEGGPVYLPCGIKLSVNRNILPITITNDVGRNVAILGGAENLQVKGAVPGSKNMAIGILQGFGVSLALQHPDGNARFVMIDGLASEVRKNSNISGWLRLMERFGFPVEVVDAKDAANWLILFRHEMLSGIEEDTYVLGFGMDRCSNFMEMNLEGESGASSFQELLKCGIDGVHFFCWWSNINMFRTHIGFDGEGYIETKILLRMDIDTAHDILGPLVNWGIRDNRAYIHDSSEHETDSVVIPMLPLSNRCCGQIEAEVW